MSSAIRPVPFADLSLVHPGGLAEIVFAAALRIALWERRARTRVALRRLDADQLRDIGIDAQAAAAEAARPFWKG